MTHTKSRRRFTAASLRFTVSWMGPCRAATALVFSSGQVVILSRGETECLVLGHALTRLLTKHGCLPRATLVDFRVRNRVVSACLPAGEIPSGHVEFHDFAGKISANPGVLCTYVNAASSPQRCVSVNVTTACRYQNGLFPGVIVRPLEHSRVSCIIFSSGSVIVSGAKKLEHAEAAIRKLRDAIRVAKESPNHDTVSKFFQYALAAAVGKQAREKK